MAQTDEKSSVIRTQLIPLSDMQILLPNTCIAEIIDMQKLEPVKKSPEWLLGMMSWRGITVPVMSFEIANNIPTHGITKVARIAVINGITGDDNLPFYGIVSQGIPKLLAVNKSEISAVEKPDQKLPLVQEQAMLSDTTVAIPDQDKLEKLLAKELKKIK